MAGCETSLETRYRAPADVGAPPPGAIVTASGLATRVLSPGSGRSRPTAGSTVMVHYVGWTPDGTVFDASQARGGPSSIRLDQALPGWTEGVQLMVAGEKRRMWIPEELGFRGTPGMPEGPLVFDVELIGFEPPPLPVPAPEDVAAPPPGATTTPSGLAYRVLRTGTGAEHPPEDGAVSVHYTMWTTDGEMRYTSTRDPEPVWIRMDRVIPGWNEGLRTMVVGERTRLWIPPHLGFSIDPDAPRVMVVFDVELFAISGPGVTPRGETAGR